MRRKIELARNRWWLAAGVIWLLIGRWLKTLCLMKRVIVINFRLGLAIRLLRGLRRCWFHLENMRFIYILILIYVWFLYINL